jgi:hypothetical protein
MNYALTPPGPTLNDPLGVPAAWTVRHYPEKRPFVPWFCLKGQLCCAQGKGGTGINLSAVSHVFLP